MSQIQSTVESLSREPAVPQLAGGMGRLGTETAFDVLAKAKKMEEAGRSIINLGIGQPDFATPPNIVEAAVKALRDGHHGYTPANGTLALREAVAEDVEHVIKSFLIGRYRNDQSSSKQIVQPLSAETVCKAKSLLFCFAGSQVVQQTARSRLIDRVRKFFRE